MKKSATNVDESRRIIRRILRVNHAGEHGAVFIYSSQLTRAEKRYADLSHWLQETLSHEVKHRQLFKDAMPTRGAKPCRALWGWKIGGVILGSITALLGKPGVMVCTTAVEQTVHRHLTDQIAFLNCKDPELATLVRSILAEEDQHLADAEKGYDSSRVHARLLRWVVAVATEAMILLSTRGDSLKLKAAMRAAT